MGWKEERWKVGKEGGRKGGSEGGRERGREGGREGGREEEGVQLRPGQIIMLCSFALFSYAYDLHIICFQSCPVTLNLCFKNVLLIIWHRKR